MVVLPLNKRNTLAGFQWFFFIFCNTVVVPPTLQSAFQLPASALITLTQYGFITTGLACLAQALLGHRRAIMEGPTGLWWSTILTVTVGEAARGRRSTASPPAWLSAYFLGGAHHHYWRKWHWPSPGEAVQPNGNGLFHAAAGRAADYHLF